LRKDEIFVKQELLKQLEKELKITEQQMYRQAERIASQKSTDFKNNLSNLIEQHLDNRMSLIEKQNAKLNDLISAEKKFLDSTEQYKHIEKSCQEIIYLSKNNRISNDSIKKIINNMAEEVSNNQVYYRSNRFTTARDILCACFGGEYA
jgi:hypothetical protein